MLRKSGNNAAAIPSSPLTLPPAALGLLLQLAAFMLVWMFARLSPVIIPLLGYALIQGVLAASLTRLAGMPRWWLAIGLLFAPALVGALSLQLSSSWYLAAFVLLVLVYWSVFKTRVPLFLTSSQAHAALADLLPDAKDFSMIDLGSGLGGVLAKLSSLRADGKYIGVESAPLPFVISRLRLFGRRNCRLVWGDFWQRGLGDFDLVYAYLSPVPMAKLWHKAKQEMKPGSLFVSNTFAVPGVEPERTISLDDMSGSVLYVWQI